MYTALTPILSFVSGVTGSELKDYIGGFEQNGAQTDGEYAVVAEQAFKEGISKLLFTKYGIEEENADIYVFGFDFERMCAEKIKIVLSHKSAFSDFRGIEDYITESGLGECEVNIKIG